VSADYWLVDDDGRSVDEGGAYNVTYNLGRMLRAAGFPSWDALVGAPAVEAAGVLHGVSGRLRADKERLVAEFSPANGWGSWEWAVQFVETFRDGCAGHPEAKIEAWL
jgi:hypothetical protein